MTTLQLAKLAASNKITFGCAVMSYKIGFTSSITITNQVLSFNLEAIDNDVIVLPMGYLMQYILNLNKKFD